jgi:hypothetical protein
MTSRAQGGRHGGAVVHAVDVAHATVAEGRDLFHIEQFGERREIGRHD